jgi:hypothetical protein
MSKEIQSELNKRIGSVFSMSLKINSRVSQLYLIREKIAARGYQSFDKEDILDELGRLQHIAGALHGEMLRLHDLLKQQS